MFEWDTTALGAELGAESQNTLERQQLPTAPTEPLAQLRGELLPHPAIYGHVVSWLLGNNGLLGFYQHI